MRVIADRDRACRLAEENGLTAIFGAETLEGMELRLYGDREAVCMVDDVLDGLFVLVEGKLKIHTLLPNGKSMLVRFARPMSVIGDVELMRRYPVKNEVVSVGDSLIFAAGRKLLEPELAGNPVFLRFLVGELGHKLYTLGQTSALNLLYPAESRFASYLLSLLEDGDGTRYVEEIRTSRLTETAELLGTSYRHLNRIVSRLTEEGIIERKRGVLLVRDRNKLAELAGGNLYE